MDANTPRDFDDQIDRSIILAAFATDNHIGQQDFVGLSLGEYAAVRRIVYEHRDFIRREYMSPTQQASEIGVASCLVAIFQTKTLQFCNIVDESPNRLCQGCDVLSEGRKPGFGLLLVSAIC